MASLATQKRRILSRLELASSIFKELETSSQGEAAGELRGLYGIRVRDDLEKARKEIEGIDVERVRELRKLRQNTNSVFEDQLSSAAEHLAGTYGVKASLQELLNKKKDFAAREIASLGQVLRITGKVLRDIRTFGSRIRTFFSSGWVWLLFFLLVVALILLYRYCAPLWFGRGPTLGGAEAAKKDLENLAAAASATDLPLLDRVLAVVTKVWDLIDTVGKILVALSGAWGTAILWLRR